ncbi:hypothetical protein COC96_05300 [Bacillus cereus]|nr:hypothetical protein COC96_05300 [Bacillus cereus]
MVFLSSTERRFRMEGYSKCESIYNKKIEEQKDEFDKKTQDLMKNLDEKEQLITDLILMLKKEKNKSDKDSNIINVLEMSVSVLREDIENLSGLSANNLLEDKGIPTQIKLLE